MRIVLPLLAQELVPTDVLANPWRWMGLSLKELMAVLGALALVTGILFIWAVYIRRGPRRHSHHHHHSHHHSDEPSSSLSDAQEDSASEGESERRYRRKRRRRRREHRPRNPTLAETGGLPPLRSERPPDSLP
jgi:hypothetical protein